MPLAKYFSCDFHAAGCGCSFVEYFPRGFHGAIGSILCSCSRLSVAVARTLFVLKLQTQIENSRAVPNRFDWQWGVLRVVKIRDDARQILFYLEGERY